MVDHEKFEPKATKSKVGLLGRFFSLEYVVPLERAQVTKTHTVDGVDEGYFYLIAFDY